MNLMNLDLARLDRHAAVLELFECPKEA
jgi:hypothetical protein